MLPGRSFHASWKFMEVTFVSKKKRSLQPEISYFWIGCRSLLAPFLSSLVPVKNYEIYISF
jgi:hypothetical protein